MSPLHHYILLRRRARHRQFLLLAEALLLQIRQSQRRRLKQLANTAAEPSPSPRSQSHTSHQAAGVSATSEPIPPPETTLVAHLSLKEDVQSHDAQRDYKNGPQPTMVPLILTPDHQKPLLASSRGPTNVVAKDHRGSADDDGYEHAAAADEAVQGSKAPMQATVESASESDA